MILADQEGDAEQLSKTAAKDGLNAGAVFWFFAIFSFASGAQLVLTTFKFAEKYGAALYMKVRVGTAQAPSLSKRGEGGGCACACVVLPNDSKCQPPQTPPPPKKKKRERGGTMRYMIQASRHVDVTPPSACLAGR